MECHCHILAGGAISLHCSHSPILHLETWNGISSPLGWIMGANALLPVGSALSVAPGRWTGSGPGPCRRLRGQGMLGQVGVLTPPWAWVPCEGGFSRQGAAEGKGAGGPGWHVGPSCCALLSRAWCLHLQGERRAGQRVASRAGSPETLFPQLSERSPGGPPAPSPGQGRGVDFLSQPGVVSEGSQDPGPLALASPEPVSRPCCLLAWFPMSSVFRRKACLHCVSLNCPLPAPPPGAVCTAFPTPGSPGSVQSPFSVLDRICAPVCCVPVFV